MSARHPQDAAHRAANPPRRYALTDQQWDAIRDLIPGREDTRGRTGRDNRLFVDAVLYRYRAGIPWRDLPARFGDWKNVHRRHLRWANAGVWKTVFEKLVVDPDNEYAMIDSTIVRAHQHAAGAKGAPARQSLGRSRGGWSTKIHAICDAEGRPTGFHLTPGQAHDLAGSDVLLEQLLGGRRDGCDDNDLGLPRALIADRSYSAGARMLEPLRRAGVRAVIPSRRGEKEQRPLDRVAYRLRHRIENLFGRLKQWRSLATRYDKRAATFSSALHLVACLFWIK